MKFAVGLWVAVIVAASHGAGASTCSSEGSCEAHTVTPSLLQRQDVKMSKETVKDQSSLAWTEDEVKATKKALRDLMKENIIGKGQGKSMWKKAVGALGYETNYPCQVENTGTCQEDGSGCEYFACNDDRVTDAAKMEDQNINGVKIWFQKESEPNVPKFLRLAFHDCIKNKDGSGGCDGCLNFDGMYTGKNIDQRCKNVNPPDFKCTTKKSKFLTDFQQAGGHAGLAPTTELLEDYYTRKVTYGGQTLKESGKSRADLWALAGIVAVEVMLEENNGACESGIHPYMFPESSGITFDCKATPLPLNFTWGRVDCAEADKPPVGERLRPWQTAKKEAHPNAEASGKQIAEWFDNWFGFNPRETVAIMGAHTAGAFHPGLSGFRYTWMGRESGNFQENLLNNLYYRYLALRPALIEKDLSILKDLKENGEPLPTGSTAGWLRQSRGLTPGGGPWQWFFNVTPAEGSGLSYPQPQEDNPGRSHNTMLNTDIGLFLNFATLSGGSAVPPDETQCQFLPTVKETRTTFKMYPEDAVTCRQDLPAGNGQTMADVVEEYADDQKKWLDDFYVAFLKMLSNGQSDLAAPV